jgi:leader peptidase (prepilin peptidase)/N-methyltransferase
MIRLLGTIFAGLLGLAFGSFLNVCLSRWPTGESIVHPRSHCRSCGRTLAWWENVPLASWLALRGRCQTCRAWIGWRYPLVELAVGALWATVAWKSIPEIPLLPSTTINLIESGLAPMALLWLLVALAVLDAEHQWLPDFLTLRGICVGLLVTFFFEARGDSFFRPGDAFRILLVRIVGILAAAALILLIRWIYWLIRRREGIGLGDAKLMAMLAAWLGLPGALLAFGLGVVLGAIAALVLLVLPSTRKSSEGWAHIKLPLGTFLCVGGIVSSLWGEPMIHAYLRWAGF